jgi:transposase
VARYYRRRGWVVGCEDEATFGLLPIVQRGWYRKGSRPVVTVNSKNECTNVFGARSVGSFAFMFSERKNQKAFVRFLVKLELRWGRVCLFVDNGPCHHGAILDAFLRSHRRTLRIFYFPKYSPELNPVEPCWKPARRRLANRVLPSLPSAKYNLSKVFGNANAMPKMFKYLSN